MKPLLIAACIASFLLGAAISPGHASCRVTIVANVEVAAGEFSLADLFDSRSCPEMRRAATQVRLGSAPLAGSERVLAGSAVRTAFQKLADLVGQSHVGQNADDLASILVPERITVRRAGQRASCADLARRIPQASPGTVDCGAADRIPRNAGIEFSRPAWDPALASWQLYARCVHPSDCVPFVVRIPGRERGRDHTGTAAGERSGALARSPTARITMARLAADSSLSPAGTAAGSDRALPLVRPGQTVTLLWDQDGIRLVVPAVCLDRGAPGEKVRARMGRGGAIVPAIVVSVGRVRAVS